MDQTLLLAALLAGNLVVALVLYFIIRKAITDGIKGMQTSLEKLTAIAAIHSRSLGITDAQLLAQQKEDKLNELEGRRHLLHPSEYESKRVAILNS
ncbi:hypothetical protein SAMN05444008_10923 [Cnuella takakiae]|uniref:Uncharacterized protein n=1 Tax=Cnuella takakiae TaxID=1302690 RepID=A0A1M5CDN4_9BACT|nr:hypothetical protein [Cnuella takakiae]OLY91775.1 hypothetical protein BUE76_07600 [Cnuella takakiae]SHF52829.1 hypothetical protein SAMN05444008_10923 [Cnuella takakiae]